MTSEAVIHHESLSFRKDTTLTVPVGTAIVHVGIREGEHEPRVWLCKPLGVGTASMQLVFRVVGTGQPFPANAIPVGTVMDGLYVWHIVKLVGS